MAPRLCTPLSRHTACAARHVRQAETIVVSPSPCAIKLAGTTANGSTVEVQLSGASAEGILQQALRAAIEGPPSGGIGGPVCATAVVDRQVPAPGDGGLPAGSTSPYAITALASAAATASHSDFPVGCGPTACAPRQPEPSARDGWRLCSVDTTAAGPLASAAPHGGPGSGAVG